MIQITNQCDVMNMTPCFSTRIGREPGSRACLWPCTV